MANLIIHDASLYSLGRCHDSQDYDEYWEGLLEAERIPIAKHSTDQLWFSFSDDLLKSVAEKLGGNNPIARIEDRLRDLPKKFKTKDVLDSFLRSASRTASKGNRTPRRAFLRVGADTKTMIAEIKNNRGCTFTEALHDVVEFVFEKSLQPPSSSSETPISGR